MRNSDEMKRLIMDRAINDEKIRAVTIEGSRANINETHDHFSDFDICYVVKDIREFTKDASWVEYFGEILIMQCPCDWYSQPYDYTGYDKYTYLIQFKDGNRIDLTLIDISNIDKEIDNKEPRIVLLNKDNFKTLISINEEKAFFIAKPSEQEYLDTCNEFRWLSLYVSKGLCREELYYAKYNYDVNLMDMFLKMLNWKIGIDQDFNVTTGSHSKYLKRFLKEEEMNRFKEIFPNGDYEDIWDKLFLLFDYFSDLAKYVGGTLNYFHDEKETGEVREFLVSRRENEV